VVRRSKRDDGQPQPAFATAPPHEDLSSETDPSVLKRRVNVLIRESGVAGTFERFPFLCECISDSCYATIWLTPQEYDVASVDTPLVHVAHPHTVVRLEPT
jgi:hypothetical protein